jgi:starvation-inducible outer membrane lipoprotein
MTIPSRISLLTLCLFLAACSTPPPPASGIDAPPTWQGAAETARNPGRTASGGAPSPAQRSTS